MARENTPHIAVFGRRNVGKSSIINKLAGHDLSIVSDIAGTTTDPVKKSLEIHTLGPVIIIDTAGIDDTGKLGEKRVAKTLHTIKSIDLAIIIIVDNNLGSFEEELIDRLTESEVPFFFLHNKSDIQPLEESTVFQIHSRYNTDILEYSAIGNYPIKPIADFIKKHLSESAWQQPTLLGDILNYGDIVLLITPIDNEAPEGRLILPQVQTIRDILDNDCIAIVLKEKEVDAFLRKSKIRPKLVVTDSSIFLKADAMIPKDIPLTGFSVLLARYKGPFQLYLDSTPKISELKNGDRILMLESCTHQVSCDDIGRMKIPRWLDQFTGKKLEYEVVSGLGSLPRDIKEYALIIQCGGCMITPKQVYGRLRPAIDAGIPVTNYGLAIAYIQGIYNRAIEPFIKNIKKIDYL